MNALMESQVFFFVSSIGFVILGILIAIIFIQCIRVMNIFSKIMLKVEENVNDISETTREFIEDMQHSILFRLLFPVRRKRHNTKKD